MVELTNSEVERRNNEIRFAQITHDMLQEAVLAQVLAKKEYDRLVEVEASLKKEASKKAPIDGVVKPSEQIKSKSHSLADFKLPEAAEETTVINLEELMAKLKPLLEGLVQGLSNDVDQLTAQNHLTAPAAVKAKELFQKVVKPEQPLEFLIDVHQQSRDFHQIGNNEKSLEQYADEQGIAHPELKQKFIGTMSAVYETYKQSTKPTATVAEQQEVDAILTQASVHRKTIGLLAQSQYSDLLNHVDLLVNLLQPRVNYYVQQTREISISVSSSRVNYTSYSEQSYYKISNLTDLLKMHGLYANVDNPLSSKIAALPQPQPVPGPWFNKLSR